eukprot:7341295-Prymnesium_polylepis.1
MGGGGAHRAESPAKSKLLPVLTLPDDITLNKNWTPRLAWSSLRILGCEGTPSEGAAFDRNVRDIRSTVIVEDTKLSDAGCSGVFQ